MRIIAITNQKGGTGKTTTTVNLGAALALLNKRVLLVDLDPQANATTHLGIKDIQKSTHNFLMDSGTEEIIRKTEIPGLGIIPSEIGLARAEIELTSIMGRESILKKKLNGLTNNYDYILIDCPPSLGILTINALTSADEVFIPVQAEFFALDGVSQLVETISSVKEQMNSDLEITGVILTMFDVRNNICKDVLRKVKKHFSNKVFSTLVRKNVKLAEAPSWGKPILLYDPDCFGSEDYKDLAKEVLAQRDNNE